MEIRLNKLISEAGVCSRREADNFIEMERVTVNPTLRFPWSLEVKELVANWWRKCSWISKRKTYVSFRYVRS